MISKGLVPCLEFDEVTTNQNHNYQRNCRSRLSIINLFFDINWCRWGKCTGPTAKFQATTMGDTGPCGSYRCLGVWIPCKCYERSRNARRHTQMHTFVSCRSTTRNSASACPLSFRSHPMVLPEQNSLYVYQV